jgi:peptidylprolyl isomerase
MKRQNIIIISLVTLVIAAVLLTDHFGIIRYRDLIKPLNPDATTAAKPSAAVSTASAGDSTATAATANNADGSTGNTTIEFKQDYIQRLVASVTPDQRQALLNDPAAFTSFVNQEAMNVSILQAARANNLQNEPNTRFLMDRGADNVLREIYLVSLINSKLPADFPTDQQLQEYFDKNKDNLKVVERVSVWQIFLPVTDPNDSKAVAAAEDQADRIAADIRANKVDFSVAALEYSKHEASRLNGGYMGIIKMSDLIPEISKAVSELDTGEVSVAVKSPMGYHIIRKGEVMPAQELTLDQIRNDIKGLMINQARNQLRVAINEQIAKSYPVSAEAAEIEQWRQAILTANSATK